MAHEPELDHLREQVGITLEEAGDTLSECPPQAADRLPAGPFGGVFRWAHAAGPYRAAAWYGSG